MYDVLFIDDKFEEVKDTFFDLQKDHIRCFYSDGYTNLPSCAKAKLPFKNLKYISLDLFLENRGISRLDKTAASTLSSVVKKFIDTSDINLHIIINTSFAVEFEEAKDNFIKYLGFTPEIIIKNKTGSTHSTLHKQSIMGSIRKASHQSILRNLIIREAIEIENSLVQQICTKFSVADNKLSKSNLKDIKKFDFESKINLFKIVSNDNDSLDNDLNDLRELRNNFAHEPNPLQKDLDLLDVLEKIDKLQQNIKSLEVNK